MARFERIASLGDVKDGEVTLFEVAGNPIAIANVGGSLYGFHNVCTHMGCSLAQGVLDDSIVTCPCHGSQFDVTTGEVRRGPAFEPVVTYPVQTQGDDIEVGV
jgi:nitrite reductase/ring-hydroxylating ferredoxin subunit